MNKILKGAVSVMMLSVVTWALASVQLSELNSTKDGSGNLRFRTRSSNSNVSRAKVNLKRDGSVEISIVKGDSEKFKGRWYNDGNRRVRITINDVSGDRASGSGTVEHDGRGSFTNISLTGFVGSSQYNFSFNAGSTGGGGDYEELRATRNGSGDLSFRTRSSNNNVNSLTVWLKSNHDFEIRPFPGSEVFKGRWWTESSKRVKLDVDRVGNDSASGVGYVDLEGNNSFERASVSGKVGSTTFNLMFKSSDRWDNGNDNGNANDDNKEYRMIARRAIKDKFSSRTDFDFGNESVGNLVFGQRIVKGELTAKGGDRPGRYRYTVTLGGGTNSVKSVTYSRI